jgi:hypothetical protein
MENFKRFFMASVFIYTGILFAQQPVLLEEYIGTSYFCASDYGGQEIIFLEPSTGFLVTSSVVDRSYIHSFVSLDGGVTWIHTSPINGSYDEPRAVTVSGDVATPIFVYGEREGVPMAPPWVGVRPCYTIDDFGWGGGSYIETSIADTGTSSDHLCCMFPVFDISTFDPNLRGISAHHHKDYDGGEYEQFFYSHDGGATWSDRNIVVKNGVNVDNLANNTFDFCYGPNGQIFAAGTAEPFISGHDECIYYMFSNDSGKTWSDPTFLPWDTLEPNWGHVDRGTRAFIDADNNFHIFTLARGPSNSELFKGYDIECDLTDTTWTLRCIAEPILIDYGLAMIHEYYGDAAALNAPTLDTDNGTIYYSFHDVVDTTGGINDFATFTIYSEDGGETWSSERYITISDTDYQAEEFTDVARTANNDTLHITYCKVFKAPIGSGEPDTVRQYYLKYNLIVSKVEGDAPVVVKDFMLYQNYPNPFNPITNIKFELMKNSKVSLVIYNVLGKKVATLIDNKAYKAGPQEIEWNAADFASAVYLYQLTTADGSCVTKKMILLK